MSQEDGFGYTFSRVLSPWRGVRSDKHRIRNVSITLGIIAHEASLAAAAQQKATDS